ncbi:MAG: hypothetical protein RLY58_1163 [Pseudomonadota bacterium]|jgi:hypothetical protein
MELRVLYDQEVQSEIEAILREAFSTVTNARFITAVGYGVLTNDTGTMFVPVIGFPSEKSDSVSYSDFQFDAISWLWGAPEPAATRGSSLLNSLYEHCEDDDNDSNWHQEFQSRSYHILVRALEQLRKEGFFPSKNEAFVTVWVVDSDKPNIRGRSWAKRLNPTNKYLEFVAWLDRVYGVV